MDNQAGGVVPDELAAAVENLQHIPIPVHVCSYFTPLEYALLNVDYQSSPSDTEEDENDQTDLLHELEQPIQNFNRPPSPTLSLQNESPNIFSPNPAPRAISLDTASANSASRALASDTVSQNPISIPSSAAAD